MSKKKLLEFGLKEADAFQKNFKIILDRLIRGYKSVMGKDPEGLDLLKVKMEARQKAIDTTKVVNQKGLTLDPSKPIVGGTQEGIETIKTKFDLKETQDAMLRKEMKELDENMKFFQKEIDKAQDLPKGQRPFGDNIRDAYREAGRSREDASEIIEALGSPGARKSYEIMEEVLGVRLYGDETFEELMKIKETGVHPRGEPPIKKADGGRVGFLLGGPAGVIGTDIGAIGEVMGVGGLGGLDDDDDISNQVAGIGVLSGLTKVFGPKVGEFIFNQGRKKVMDNITQSAIKKAREIELAKEAKKAREATAVMAAANRAAGRGGFQSDFSQDKDFMGGRGTAAEMGSFADGGLASMFMEKR